MLLPWQRGWLKTRLKNGFRSFKENPVIRFSSSFAHYELTWNPFCEHCFNTILTEVIFVISCKSFSVVLKIPSVKIQIFRDRSFTWVLNYFLAKFLEILITGSLEMGKFLRRQSSQFFEQLRMRCIQLGSSLGCSRVPQVHFVRKHFFRKQTMCKSLYTYLTICFASEKLRWLLHNTADRAETVFSHLKQYLRRTWWQFMNVM